MAVPEIAVAGVHNESDLNMLTRVGEKTVSCRASCLGIAALPVPIVRIEPRKSELAFFSEPALAHTFKTSD